MREQDSRSPEQIEEQIERTRHDLNETLDELRRRFSAGDMFDETLHYLRNQNIGRRLTTSAREHPLPLVLMGTGLLWLIASGASTGRKLHSGGSLSTNAQASSGQSPGSASVKHEARETTRHARSGLTHAKGNFQREAENGTDRAQQTGDDMGERYSNAKSQVSNRAHELQDRYHDRTQQARQRFDGLIEERPLLLVAVGFGLGAALGMMLPSTTREDRLMGETRDSVRDRVMTEGQHQFEKAREKVETAAENTREKVEGDSLGEYDTGKARESQASDHRSHSGSETAGQTSQGSTQFASGRTGDGKNTSYSS